MSNRKEIPKIVREISLPEIQRIDVALEGAWSQSVFTVWTRAAGFKSFSDQVLSHQIFKPSLELYFENYWLGIHCYNLIDNIFIFDTEFALEIIRFIEKEINH